MGMEGFSKKIDAIKKVVTTTAAVGTLAMSAQAEGGEGGKGKDSTDAKNKIEVSHVKPVEKNNTINFYTSSNTEAGATTPTGLNNSFLNNEFGIKTGDVQKIAEEHGFSTNSETEFQKDLFSFLEQSHPDIIKYLLEKYGQTAAGTLTDGLLGVRTAEAISLLEKKEVKTPVPEVKHEIPQPNTSYMVDVRGDEPGRLGGFFFVKSLEDMKKINAAINFSRAEEFDGGARAQTGVNMNMSVFLEQVSPETKALLGPVWHRDPNDASKFIPDANMLGDNMDVAGK